MSNIISISDIYEIRNRKKLELEYYPKQLEELKNKMFFMEKEIEMTTFIIDIIENEKVNIINRS